MINNKAKLTAVFLLLISNVLIGQSADTDLQKVETVYNYIDQFYVEDVDNNKIAEAAIVSMLKELDPHSVYISKDEVQAMNEPLVGNFEGVGIQFNILDDTIVVVATIAGGPSEKVGLLAGDKIVNIDDELVAGIGITNKGVMNRLRGEKDSEVGVEIKREGVKKLLDFKIIRDKIPLYSVDAAYMATDKIGYVKINRFAAKTNEEFRNALVKLKSEGMESLIIDLKGNPGGYLNAAFYLADELLGDGKLIVYTEGKNSPRNDMTATRYGNFEEGDIVVLIDQYSASASEILSGAIQDWDRGVVVGRRSFGKGLVQKPFPLPDGSQIRLTIADYYTPSGRFIQKPYENGVDEYRKDIINRLNSGELTDSLVDHFPDSLKFKTNNGRTVYGGGGITPDVFVPLDTTFSTDFYSDVLRKGYINQFALKYANNYRDELTQYYPNVKEFDTNFTANDEFLGEFLNYIKEKELEYKNEEYEKSKLVLGVQLKALVARNIYDGEAYYYVVNKVLNDEFKKAIEILKSNKINNYLSYE
ncbi:MAG: S41 family peptidase [Chitinophagales bacterium]|nr:S41 family peptidase [Chitinophagales bacterium]